MSKPGYVYIMANARPTLYVGVTSQLAKRAYEHREDLMEGFTKRYKLHKLVYYEAWDDISDAIKREKAIKHWKRAWKLRMICEVNPNFEDLYDSIV